MKITLFMVRSSSRKKNLGAQAGFLKSVFKEASLNYSSTELTWKGKVTPSPLSRTYTIKIIYKKGKRPKVSVLEPELVTPEGRKLPHIYAEDDLCLYYPNGKEWNAEKFLATTILPWTSEWLYHYEIWLATGTWNGGGKHPVSKRKSVTLGKRKKRNYSKRQIQ